MAGISSYSNTLISSFFAPVGTSSRDYLTETFSEPAADLILSNNLSVPLDKEFLSWLNSLGGVGKVPP